MNKIAIVLIQRFKYFLLFGCVLGVWAGTGNMNAMQPQKSDTASVGLWNGFEREVFSFEGREAWIVKPLHPLPGNPWLWKAYFPNWHITIDSILLQKGFYMAFINTADMYGNPESMQIWDRFYDYLVNRRGFASRVALDGISRGALYVYAWAKRNPLNVSCIYGETPLCDFKSWPGGKLTSKGSEIEWNMLLNRYGFTDEQAVNYDDNPKDNLQGLAACNVPILHVIGLDDKICPPEENTFPLVNNYIRFGGTATVFPMSHGKQELEGHHFPIEKPDVIANFIYNNSYPVAHPLDASPYITLRSGLKNCLLKFTIEKKGTVAFMGGSITENPGWRNMVCKYLKECFPQTDFTFISAGISSTGSTPGAFRLDKDVLSKGKIDLLFEDAAVNDRVNFFNGTAQLRGMEGIVRHALTVNPFMDIILLYFASPDNSTDYRKGIIPEVIINHEKVASHYQITSINLAKEITDRIDAREFTWDYDFKDIHPSPFGQETYFRTLKKLIFTSMRTLDAKASMIARPLPAAIDKFSYTHGLYLPVADAKLMNNWQLVENWLPPDSISTRRQYINLPTLIAEKPGATMELTFMGNAVGICVVSGPDAGFIEYKIDNQPYKKLDLFTIWSKNYQLPWYLMLAENLPDQKHILIIRTISDKNTESKGNACRIVHFLINK